LARRRRPVASPEKKKKLLDKAGDERSPQGPEGVVKPKKQKPWEARCGPSKPTPNVALARSNKTGID